jgi:hypothetical protein
VEGVYSLPISGINSDVTSTLAVSALKTGYVIDGSHTVTFYGLNRVSDRAIPIAKVPYPVIGSAPTKAAFTTTQWTAAAFTWYETNTNNKITGNFGGSKQYEAVIAVTATGDYSFDGLSASAFTYSGTGVQTVFVPAGKTGTLRVIFPRTVPAELASLSVSQSGGLSGIPTSLAAYAGDTKNYTYNAYRAGTSGNITFTITAPASTGAILGTWTKTSGTDTSALSKNNNSEYAITLPMGQKAVINIPVQGVGQSANYTVTVANGLATGGTVTLIGSGTNWNEVHTFTTVGSSTLKLNQNVDDAPVLIVGGGGGGGFGESTQAAPGGGGGAGGVHNTDRDLVANSDYTVVVGGGGAGTGSAFDTAVDGTFSSFNGLTGAGGGKGGNHYSGHANAGADGGSGGGGGGTNGGKSYNALGYNYGAGNNGGDGGFAKAGGGGGAGGPGQAATGGNGSGGAGGSGTYISISGSPVYYAYGGAGGKAGGGGSGGANTGSGGAGSYGGTSGSGGSGIVIVSLPVPTN